MNANHLENDGENRPRDFVYENRNSSEYLSVISALKQSFDKLLEAEEFAEDGRIKVEGIESRSLITRYVYLEFEEPIDSPIIHGRKVSKDCFILFRTVFPQESQDAQHYIAVLCSKIFEGNDTPVAFGSNVLHLFADGSSRVFSAARINPGGQVASNTQMMNGGLGPNILYDEDDDVVRIVNRHPDYKLSPYEFLDEHWHTNQLNSLSGDKIVISKYVTEDLYPFGWFLKSYLECDIPESFLGS